MEERSFIQKSLKNVKVANRVLAGRALVRKNGLDGRELKWGLAEVDGRRRLSKDGERDYWAFVARAMKLRNER